MYALTALARNTHRFLQQLQAASVACYHHASNPNNQQDHADRDTRDGACRMIAKSLHLVQHTYDKCDNTNHNNNTIERSISHSIEPFLSLFQEYILWHCIP